MDLAEISTIAARTSGKLLPRLNDFRASGPLHQDDPGHAELRGYQLSGRAVTKFSPSYVALHHCERFSVKNGDEAERLISTIRPLRVFLQNAIIDELRDLLEQAYFELTSGSSR